MNAFQKQKHNYEIVEHSRAPYLAVIAVVETGSANRGAAGIDRLHDSGRSPETKQKTDKTHLQTAYQRRQLNYQSNNNNNNYNNSK